MQIRSINWLALALLGGAAWALPAVGRAQDGDDVGPFHWGYAPMFGRGTYSLGDGTEARVYRGAFAVRLRETQDDRPGVRLLLPVTVGVQRFDDEDLPPERIADRLEHAAFQPGVELEFSPGERWTLRTSAQVGEGRKLEGVENRAALFSAGVRSKLQWDEAPGKPALINGLLWTAFDPDEGSRGSLLRATAALEFEVGVPGWQFRDRPMRLLPHVLGDWYSRPPPALAPGDVDGDVEKLESEWQLGVAAGPEGGFKILWFKFDNVGVAYRFSDHSSGVRLYLNSVF